MPHKIHKDYLLTTCSLLLAAAPLLGQNRQLPLDPLTRSERAMADTVARTYPKVREFLRGAPTRLINVDLLTAKLPTDAPQGPDVPPRRGAEVLFYRADQDQGLRVWVDLTERRVIDLATMPGQSVPLSQDEVTVAARLALANAQVIRLFGGRLPSFRVATGPATQADSARIEGLRTVATAADDPCYRQRCVVLFFRVGNRYVHMNRVFVNLTNERVTVRGAKQ